MSPEYLRSRLTAIVQRTAGEEAESLKRPKRHVAKLAQGTAGVDAEYLKRQIAKIIQGTTVVPSYFIGDKKAEAQLRDNLRAGRTQWRAAHNDARSGLDALDRGELELAEAHMREAEGLAAAALEAQMTAPNYRDLVTPAEGRGRRVTTADRNQRLAAAYDDALAQGKKGREARVAAKNSNPDCAGMTDSALKKAIERGQKTGDKK